MTNTKQYYFMHPVRTASDATTMEKIVATEFSKYRNAILDENGLHWLVENVRGVAAEALKKSPRLKPVNITLKTPYNCPLMSRFILFGRGCSVCLDKVSMVIENQ